MRLWPPSLSLRWMGLCSTGARLLLSGENVAAEEHKVTSWQWIRQIHAQRGFKSAWAKDLILDFSPPPHKYSETCAQKNVFKYSQSHGFCLFHITDKNDVTIIMFLTINLTVNWVFLIKVGNRSLICFLVWLIRHFDRLWFVLLLSERVFPSVWQPPWPVSELPVSPVPDLWRCFWSSRRLGCPLRTSASWSLSTGCCKFNVNTNDIFKTYRNSLI